MASGTALLLPPYLAGCRSVPDTPASCNGTSEIDAILCRQDLFLNSAPNYITLGMLIGAGLGIGLAVGARVHPAAAVAAAILGAALATGGVAAVDQYWQYRLKEANGNEFQAKADVRRDIGHDNEFSIATKVDAKVTTDAIRKALANPDHKLSENAAQFGKCRQVTQKLERSNDTLFKGIPIYATLLPIVQTSSEPDAANKIRDTHDNARSIAEEVGRQVNLEMGKDAGWG